MTQNSSSRENSLSTIVRTSSEALSEPTFQEECHTSYEVEGINALPPGSHATMEEVEMTVHSSMPSKDSTWPFNWATVDIPGSPGLSRLFSALEIEYSESEPQFSLDQPDIEDLRHISRVDIMDLWNERNQTMAYDLHASHSPGKSRPTFELSKKPNAALPWRDPALAFCGWAPNPLDEIYVFPSNPSQFNLQHPDPVAPSFLTLEIQAAELQTKLSKLDQLLPESHPSITVSRMELADTYLAQGHYNKAEQLYRCSAIAAEKTWGSTSLTTFYAWLDVVSCLTFQGFDVEAHALVNKLRPTILQFVDPEHEIATRATMLLAVTCDNLGNSTTAEDLSSKVSDDN
jgi:hypothetical protein